MDSEGRPARIAPRATPAVVPPDVLWSELRDHLHAGAREVGGAPLDDLVLHVDSVDTPHGPSVPDLRVEGA